MEVRLGVGCTRACRRQIRDLPKNLMRPSWIIWVGLKSSDIGWVPNSVTSALVRDRIGDGRVPGKSHEKMEQRLKWHSDNPRHTRPNEEASPKDWGWDMALSMFVDFLTVWATKDKFLLFYVTKFVVICFGSHRRLIQKSNSPQPYPKTRLH